jgi:uncharacterized membrane protein YccF (DUF307 family)
MGFLGNIIWFVVGGWYISLSWLFASIIFAISIIGLPIARDSIEMAKMSAFPFGKEVVHIRDMDQKELSGVTAVTGTVGFITNIIWLLSFGWILFLEYLLAGIIDCCTIIGIPFGIQSLKLSFISLWPVGRRVVSKSMYEEITRRNINKDLDSRQGKSDEKIVTERVETVIVQSESKSEELESNPKIEESIESKIEKLNIMKEKGLINEEEFNTKKESLLKEM